MGLTTEDIIKGLEGYLGLLISHGVETDSISSAIEKVKELEQEIKTLIQLKDMCADTIAELRKKEALPKKFLRCRSCGEVMSEDCPKCKKDWEN